MKRDGQRDLLDGFGDHDDISEQVSRAFEKWDGVTRELHSLTEAAGESGAQRSLLKYQAEELEGLGLEEDEVERLEQEYKRLVNLKQSARNHSTVPEQSVRRRAIGKRQAQHCQKRTGRA